MIAKAVAWLPCIRYGKRRTLISSFLYVLAAMPSQGEVLDTAPVRPLQAPVQAVTAAELSSTIDTCREAIDTADRLARDFPSGLLLAIAETESGRAFGDDFGPWPWTLNIAGKGQFFETQDAALVAAQAALDAGVGNIDIGCMQISEMWHGWAFADLESMLDPRDNTSYASAFLSSLYATHGNWRDAISHYHSSNPVLGFTYTERVLNNWRRNMLANDFIAADDSLSDVSRLVANLIDIRQIEQVEAEYFVAVTVSERYDVANVFLVKAADGSLYVSLNDLAEVPFNDRYSLPLVLYDDSVLIDLNDVTSFEALLDEAENQLNIIARAGLFAPQEFRSDEIVRPAELSHRPAGGHLNYRFVGNFAEDAPTDLSGIFDAVGYWGNRTFRISVLVDDDLAWKRLGTTLTVDDFENRRQLIIGNTTTPAGTRWGSNHPIFGLSWGTHFALDPSFSPRPDYAIFGTTDIPAVARFLVDGKVLRETALEPGSYAFSDLPFPDQFGDMTIAVDDVQGQTRYFKVPYIRVPELYRAGLHSYNYGIGFKNVASDDQLGRFGGLVFGASHRYGFSDTFTADVHASLSAGSLAIGATGDVALLDTNRFVSSTLAASSSELGLGVQAEVSYGSIKRDTPSLFNAALRFTSEDFYIGTETLADSADRQGARWSLRLASSLGGALPITLNYDFRDTWADDVSHSLSAGRAWSLPDGWNLSASGNYTFSAGAGTSNIALGLSKSFGTKSPTHVHLSNVRSGHSGNLDLSLQRTQHSGTGLGYYGRLSANPDTGGMSDASLGLDSQSEKRSYTANMRISGNDLNMNASVSGAIGFLDGETFTASSLNAPYVLVRSGDARALPIQLNYNHLGDTDSRGLLVADGLVPFARNTVAFKPEDLGFDFSISDVDYTLILVPVMIGGYVAEFAITEQFPATVILVDSAGVPLPAGSLVLNVTTDETAGVTMDGMVYLENVQDGQSLQADLGRFGTCSVALRVAQDFAKFDEIGPFTCE